MSTCRPSRPGSSRSPGALSLSQKIISQQALPRPSSPASHLHITRPLPSTFYTYSTMIQRTLLRQSRVLSSSIRSAAPRTSLASPQFRPTPISLGASRQAASRWYSSEPEAKKAEEAEKKTEDVDPVKKELEAKNKEILELKVSLVATFLA